MAEHPIRRFLTNLGPATAHPAAFGGFLAFGILWFLFDRESFNWGALAVLATWVMTFLIQRSQYRDTLALHAKLDELLKAVDKAETRLARIDEKEPEEIEKLLAEQRREIEEMEAGRAA